MLDRRRIIPANEAKTDTTGKILLLRPHKRAKREPIMKRMMPVWNILVLYQLISMM
jgi:hypothetical protein